MRRLVYFVAASVDGKIAGPDGTTAFLERDGGHWEAQVAEFPETVPTHLRQLLEIDGPPRRFDTVLMGRRTHEVALDAGLTSGYQHLDQHVFTHDDALAHDATVTLQDRHPRAVLEQLRTRPGQDIWLCGGGELAGQLSAQLDELIVKVHPVVVGDGIGLFAGAPAPVELRLTTTRCFDSGVTVLRYER
ncbi:MAG: dihydrofolate reductase family protein [Tetrasphaera sp.]